MNNSGKIRVAVTNRPEPMISLFLSRTCALLCAAILTLVFLSEHIGITTNHAALAHKPDSATTAQLDRNAPNDDNSDHDNGPHKHGISSLFTNTEAVNIFDTTLHLSKPGIKTQPDLPPLAAVTTQTDIKAGYLTTHILCFNTAIIPEHNIQHKPPARAPPVISA